MNMIFYELGGLSSLVTITGDFPSGEMLSLEAVVFRYRAVSSDLLKCRLNSIHLFF